MEQGALTAVATDDQVVPDRQVRDLNPNSTR